MVFVRNDRGDEMTSDEVLECLKKRDVTSGDIMEMLGISYSSAHNHLFRLKSKGLVHVARYEFRSGKMFSVYRLGYGKNAKRKYKLSEAEKSFRRFCEISRIWDNATRHVVVV